MSAPVSGEVQARSAADDPSAPRPPEPPRTGPEGPPPPLLVGAAAAVGVVVAVAVRTDVPGLGWWVAVLAAALGVGLVGVGLRGSAVVPSSRRARIEGAGWALAAVLLAGVAAVRAAEWLTVLCLLVAGGAGSLAVAGRAMPTVAAGAAAVPVAALRSLPWVGRAVLRARRDHGSGLLRAAVPVVVGLVLLAVFGSLLAEADAAFAEVLDGLLPAVSGIAVADGTALFGMGALVVLGAGFLLLSAPPCADAEPAPPRRVRLLDWALPVGLLVALFALFVGVQVTTLLRGDTHVLRTTGLTYAEYARSGFWQLLAVTVLALAVIVLAARWAPEHRVTERAAKRGLLGALALLTLVIVASAVGRMWLYQQAYGFTVLRLLVLSCELWLGVCFLLVLVSVLRLRPGGVVRGMAATGVAALLALAVLDPERFVAEQDVARHAATGTIDIEYLSGLSADAVPALARLPEPLRSCALHPIANELAQRDARLRGVVPNRSVAPGVDEGGDEGERDEDWRSTNLSRAAAVEVLVRLPLSCPA